MRNRKKILRRTLKLINSDGPVALRIKDLSSGLKLSPGNITYYFPKKEDLLTCIHQEYEEEVAKITEAMSFRDMDLFDLWEYQYEICQIQWNYRGLILFQMTQIANPNKKEANRAKLEYRYKKFWKMISEYKKSGLIDSIRSADSFCTWDCHSLIRSAWIIQYIPYATEGNLDEALKYFAYLELKPFEPFFSEKGLRQFRSLQRKYGKRPF